MQTILLSGGTGLIGVELLARLLMDEGKFRVVAPTRRAIGFAHANLINPVVDAMSRSDEMIVNLLREAGIEHVDAYACCLGSTIRKAGSEMMFRAIDHGLVLRYARIARAFDATQALLVSAVGADPKSGVFYLRVKGETERDLAQCGFRRVDLLRPAQLLGAREETRPIEWLAQKAARFYNPWLKGELTRYRAINAADVAAAMHHLVGQAAAGVHLHLHDNLLRAAQADAGTGAVPEPT